jgi:hypothetical protein
MKYFELYELVDKATYERMGEAAWGLFNPEILIALDDLREFLDTPLTVNTWYKGGDKQYRGYRSPECTEGATKSQHRLGNAFDALPKIMTAEEARRKILADQDNPLVCRITRLEAGVVWIHFDLLRLTADKQRIYIFKG